MRKIKNDILFWFAVFSIYLLDGAEKLYRGLKSFLIKWNEFITIPVGWFLVKWSEPFIVSTYPGSTRYDTGFYYDVVYSAAAGFIIHGISFIIFKINWLFIEKYLDVNLESDFKSLTSLQRISVALWLCQSYFWAFIALFWIVSWTGVK